jgi:hypothetical protein
VSGRCCASTFLRRPSTERASSTVVHREFIVTKNVETHSVFFSHVLLPEKPSWLASLGSDTAWFSLFSHDSIQTSPNESNLKLDVILASLSINVILLCQYLLCENVFVKSPCCGGCHILAGSRMQPLVAAKSWLVPGCHRQPAGYCRDGRCIYNGH